MSAVDLAQSSTGRWDLVVLSPHLDDAALSAGGEIHRVAKDGGRVLVLTIFTADAPIAQGPDALDELSPLAREVHRVMKLGADAMAIRRREDTIACRRLGATVAHWPFVDAIYRIDAEGRPRHAFMDSLFGEPGADDLTLADGLQGLLRSLDTARVLAPLGVGGHVDHRLVHRAAHRVWGSDVVYYEDFPYVRKWGALDHTLRRLGGRDAWRAERVPLDRDDLQARIEACRAYASQIAPLFGTERRMRRRIRRIVRRRGGERRWRSRS
ncbi:MAG: PIG-L family deacetylase [Acidobacteriota bacterium]